MTRWTMTIVLVSVLLALLLPGCGGEEPVIKIGFAGPLTGDSKEFGVQAQWGAELFL